MNSNPDSSSYLSIFIISSIYSFKIINAVAHDSKILYWITAFVADTVVANPNGIKTPLANNVSTFLTNGKLAFINGRRKLKNPLFWLIMFLVVLFNKVPLYFKSLITVIISSIYSLFFLNL